MHAFTTEATRLCGPIVDAARWNGKRRRRYFRLRFRLRNFARALASRLIGVQSGVLKALHDSRRQLAARVIDENRHLIQDYQCIGVLHCANDTGFDARQTEFTEQ